MIRWEIFVVDDSARFPLHVWRYVTGCLGFGIGQVGVDGFWAGPPQSQGEKAAWISETPLLSDDGSHRLWWVPADDASQQKLAWIFSRLEAQSLFYALVDIHGKRGTRYRAEDVFDYLAKQKNGRQGGDEIRLVSAYHSGHRFTEAGKPIPVLPKSRETLSRIIREVGIEQKETSIPEKVRHVLVTGAGFEICSDRGGFGVPLTSEILEDMEPALEMGWFGTDSERPAQLGQKQKAPPGVFPIPVNGIWTETAGRTEGLKAIALEADLDSYWDFLLEKELQEILGDVGRLTAAARDKRKAKAVVRERLLREAFRRALRCHDWGFMNQSLDAARMPLHAWLTTNYTHFADRAISLYGDAQERSKLRSVLLNTPVWRIISTAAEACALAREDIGTANAQVARYLFKLHGDIGHLQTMAVAGHDKDYFSPLSMPVEDLYQIYAAAGSFLIESFRVAQPTLVVWHIVGHGLQDRRLCDLLARVWAHRKCDQVFAIVNPQAQKPKNHLSERLEEINPEGRRSIYSCGLRAAEYMARLFQLLHGNHGRPHEIRTVEDLVQWLDCVQGKGDGPNQALF
jgi:hypothetical protein